MSLQPQYSLVERNIEREVLPACREEGGRGDTCGVLWVASSRASYRRAVMGRLPEPEKTAR